MIGVIKSCNINIKQEGSVTQATDSNSSIGSIYYSETPVKVGQLEGKDVFAYMGKITELNKGAGTFKIDNFPKNVDLLVGFRMIRNPFSTMIFNTDGVKYDPENDRIQFYSLKGGAEFKDGITIFYEYTLK